MSARVGLGSAAQEVFGPELGTYASFRIPAIVAAGSTLLAFCEGRRNSAADSGEIDIVLRRSTDGGASWGPLSVVASEAGRTIGNPAPVAVPGSNIVVLLQVRNDAGLTESEIIRGTILATDSRRVFVQTSDNGGQSFGAARDITASTKLDSWGWYATGPGHGISVTDGRLIVPSNHSVLGTPTPRAYGAHCIYSDDGGQDWSIGFVDHNSGNAANANESTAAQLPDGRLYLNARNQDGSADGTRLDAYSSDRGESLQRPYEPQPQIQTPVVQGSVLQCTGGPLLYSGPRDPAARRQLSLQVSSDGGRSWHIGALFDDAPAAYSDLVALDSESVGVLYETGTARPYETIRFQRVALRELTYTHQD